MIIKQLIALSGSWEKLGKLQNGNVNDYRLKKIMFAENRPSPINVRPGPVWPAGRPGQCRRQTFARNYRLHADIHGSWWLHANQAYPSFKLDFPTMPLWQTCQAHHRPGCIGLHFWVIVLVGIFVAGNHLLRCSPLNILFCLDGWI